MAAAALSFYMTMSVFPLIITICSFVGGSNESLAQMLGYADTLLPDNILALMSEFFIYAAEDNMAMLPLGLSLLISNAATALRALNAVIGALQGGLEHRGVKLYLYSLVFSLALLAVLYITLLAMLFSGRAAEKLCRVFPTCPFVFDVLYLRYVILALILFLLLLGIYHAPKREGDNYKVYPGALFSSLCVVIISPLFSAIIGSSVKYSIVYGSIASLILLMLWLYMCYLIMCCGAVFNIALYKIKAGEEF